MKPRAMSLKLGLRTIVAAVLVCGPAAADDGLPGARVLQPTPVGADSDRDAPTLDEGLRPVPLVGATYAGFETKVTTLAGGSGLLVGGQAGWTLDPHLMVGFAGYGLASTIGISEVAGTPTAIDLAYGGVRAAYVIPPRSTLHLTLSTLAGLAGVSTTTHDAAGGVEEDGAPLVFTLEPEVEAEMNVTRSVRLAVSGSYRYVAVPELAGLEHATLSGVAGGVALKIGAF